LRIQELKPSVSRYMSRIVLVATSFNGDPLSPPVSTFCWLCSDDGRATVVLVTIKPSIPDCNEINWLFHIGQSKRSQEKKCSNYSIFNMIISRPYNWFKIQQMVELGRLVTDRKSFLLESRKHRNSNILGHEVTFQH
jgi:hypothetical protein